MRLRLPLLVLAIVASATLGGCAKEPTKEAPKVIASDEPPPGVAINRGIHPDDFKCETLATLPAVSDAVGRIVAVEFSSFPSPTGVPRGCNYFPIDATPGDAGPTPTWSFDLDCRKTAMRDARTLMARYAAEPDAVPVRIGKSGIDHRDTLLLFVDDNAPCYVRVLGPGRDNRTALGAIIAASLKPTNAPSIR